MSENLPTKEQAIFRTGVQCLCGYERSVCPVVFDKAATQLARPSESETRDLKTIREIKGRVAALNGETCPDGTNKEKHDWSLKGWLLFREELIGAGLYRFPKNDPEIERHPIPPQEEKSACREVEDEIDDLLDGVVNEAKELPEEATPSPSVPSSASNKKAGKFTVEFVENIMLDEPEPEVIEEVLPAKGVVTIYGADRLGKTFVSVDMAIRIAAGMHWHGKHVEQKPVRYFYLEAGGGLKRRLKAWMIEYPDMFPSKNIGFIRENAIDIVKDWKDIVPLVPKGGVVFIDTLHKSAAGKDENSNTDMGLVLKAAGELARAIDGLVVIIHHTGKDKNKGMRGAQCLRDDVTGTLAINEKNGNKYIEVEKNKDELAGERYPYYLKVRDTGDKKPTGKSITSCVAIPDTVVNPEDIKPVTKDNTGPVLRSTAHILAYKALCDLLDQNHGEPVAKAIWRKEYYRLNPIESQNPDGPTAEEKDKHGKTFRNAIASLLAKDMITALDGEYYGKK